MQHNRGFKMSFHDCPPDKKTKAKVYDKACIKSNIQVSGVRRPPSARVDLSKTRF